MLELRPPSSQLIALRLIHLVCRFFQRRHTSLSAEPTTASFSLLLCATTAAAAARLSPLQWLQVGHKDRGRPIVTAFLIQVSQHPVYLAMMQWKHFDNHFKDIARAAYGSWRRNATVELANSALG